jgi:hypothetical protein
MPPTPPRLNLLIRPHTSTTYTSTLTSTSLIPLKRHRSRSLRMMTHWTRSSEGIRAPDRLSRELERHRCRPLRMMTRSGERIRAAHGRSFWESLLGYTSNTSISSNAIAVAECRAVRAMNSPSARIVTGHGALLFGERTVGRKPTTSGLSHVAAWPAGFAGEEDVEERHSRSCRCVLEGVEIADEWVRWQGNRSVGCSERGRRVSFVKFMRVTWWC